MTEPGLVARDARCEMFDGLSDEGRGWSNPEQEVRSVTVPRFIDVDGTRTRYIEAGKGEPLVLIHGGQFGSYYSANHWDLNLDDLASSFHVYALDKLGQGYTDNPATDEGYTMTAVIDHVRKFLLALDLRDAVLVGHSRGALPATRIAVDQPELARALVIVDSNTLAPDHPSVQPDFYWKLDAGAPDVPDEAYVRREPDANSYARDHITPDFLAQLLEIARLPKVRDVRQHIQRHLTSQFLPDLQKRKHETLDAIRDGHLKVPTLVIWGANDRSAPIDLGVQLFEHIAMALDRTQLHVFNHAGHYVYREHPHEFSRLITAFVSDLP